ncbi:MAG TPA: hypothetical protein DCE44_20730 [Verrucomicrobiales bacterium]|nr:hypothetical protein [Verrucomicrobiales bacterium]
MHRLQFISHSEGSLAKLETQFRLSRSLGFMTDTRTTGAFSLMNELRQMLNALRRRLDSRHSSPVTRHKL